MFSSLRFRLWLTYILVVGIVLVIAGLALGVFFLRNPLQDRRELQRLRLISGLIVQRSQILNLGQISNLLKLQEMARRADELASARIAIFSPEGMLLADSRADSASALPAWSFFENRRPAAAPVYRDEAGRQWLYAITPLADGSQLLAVVARPRLQIFQILRDDVLAPVLRGALLAVALAVLFAIWIANWIASPLQRLEKATRQVSSDSFQEVPLQGPREIQAVARSFNDMAERVQASQRSQRDLVANISHDLKTPLTSIQGFAQAILDGTAQDVQSARQAAQVIYDEAGRMNRMVSELLDLARMEAGALSFERKQIDLEALLEQVLGKFIPQARQAQVELHMDDTRQAEGGLIIIADEDRLAQVFSNLVENALKYTPAGGEVTVRTQKGEGFAEVQVIDDGPGIPSGDLGRIFERFYQVDKARSGGVKRGLGLGLAIAREIVQAHHGSIAAYNRSQFGVSSGSSPDSNPAPSGCVFVVRLPLARPNDETLLRGKKDLAPRSLSIS